MGKKYIIELKDNTAWLQWVNVVEDGIVYFDYKYPEDLTPYTEPDLDAIRKEAYDEGYQEGMQLSIDDAKLKEEYKHGLNDAWECVRKLFSLTYDEKGKIFRTTSVRDIMRKYSASEAIEKIRQYEQEKEKKDGVWIASETWIMSEANEPSVDTTLICSKCGYEIKIKPHETPALNFCPKCGDCKKPKEEES